MLRLLIWLTEPAISSSPVLTREVASAAEVVEVDVDAALVEGSAGFEDGKRGELGVVEFGELVAEVLVVDRGNALVGVAAGFGGGGIGGELFGEAVVDGGRALGVGQFLAADVVRRGARLGVATPVMATLAATLSPYQYGVAR